MRDAAARSSRRRVEKREKLRAACYADGASKLCADWIAYAKAAEATYRSTPDNAALRDEIRFGMYSDAAERTEIQRLINSTPHASPMGPAGEAVFKSLASLALDLTPVVGDIKGFVEAETPFDYTLAAIGALGPAGDAAKALVKVARALLEAGDAVGAAAKVADAQSSIRATVGSKGAWDTALNGRLKPGAVYELSNGHKYITDASGRVEKVEGTLSLSAMDRNGYQQCATGKCGAAKDEGGHLIASSLGGAGDRINIVPQASTLNRGDWRAMENEFRNALKEGKTVTVKIDVVYPVGVGVRPNEFRVIATIDGKQVPYPPFRQ
ncbi:DNA/RNA non-specific endonuclease [Variovorax sp. PBL-H6]|uniref:DNA/RNA non-specific endonuclease n=1 Tax=Variovorax sp. PBL-H6 TaxID=434009 RepID=UPI001318A816|nr:DNA/RNA non-specific endonuclease [Variovorax sp. PBL-H6]VTU37605.1 DNA/RNA non-specific endonuclease [Variovorax sp. PBL-H6]